jgi:hypothetical protein
VVIEPAEVVVCFSMVPVAVSITTTGDVIDVATPAATPL